MLFGKVTRYEVLATTADGRTRKRQTVYSTRE